MKTSKITAYDPSLSEKENARNNGVSIYAIRHYVKVHGIDRRVERQLYIYNKALEHLKSHPNDKATQIADAIGVSPNTVRKYMRKPPKPKEKKFAVSQKVSKVKFLSVSDNQYDILKAILAIHLNHAETFDCDLTAWTCGFYRYGIPCPTWLFDKYPQVKDVEPLDRIEYYNLHYCFKSVVIDLPTSVNNPTSHKKADISTAFSTMEELYAENKKMLELAHGLLRTDGILVFKTMDFTFKDTPRWISDYVIKTAYDLGFALIDKFIYIDPKHNRIDRRRTRYTASVPAHAYFLVFRRISRL